MQLIVVETVLVVTIPGGRKGGLDGIRAVHIYGLFIQSISSSQRR